MTNKILNECYKNYLRTSKNYYSDTWKATSSQNIQLFKNMKSLGNILTNNNIRGLAPIDNYPSYEYLNNKSSKELSQLQEKEYFEIYKKNKHLTYYFGSSYTIAFRYFLNIKHLINKDSNVLIIGDGVGILSSMILKLIKCRVFLCDLPETLIYQEYFLRNNLKDYKFQYIANKDDNINFNNQVILINANELKRLRIKLNLAINTDSFCEMDKDSVNNYFAYISQNLVGGGYLYYCNPIGLSGAGYRYPSEYPLDNSFHMKNIEVLYPSHRDTFCKYLSVTVVKKNRFNNEFINKSLKTKQYIINKYYLDSEIVITQKYSERLAKKTVDIANKVSTDYKLCSKDKKLFIDLFKTESLSKNKINLNALYHHAFLQIMQFFNNGKKKQAQNYLHIIHNVKNNNAYNTCLVKIAALVRFIDLKCYVKILKIIPENYFEIVYLKFFLYEEIDLNKQKSLFKKLLKFKPNHFYDELKLYYCVCKIEEHELSKIILKSIENKITNVDNAMNLLKLLFVLGKFVLFYEYYLNFKRKYTILDKYFLSILLSSNFLNKFTNDHFKKYFSSNLKINPKNKSLENLIIRFKLGQLVEEKLVKTIIDQHYDYYSIGFVLKNTLNCMSKENIILLSKKSLILRNSPQNVNFIAEIYFYNSFYKEVLQVLNLIKKVESYSIYYALKKYLSIYAISNIDRENQIKKLSTFDFFKMIHNGRVVILPFLCTGNNAVQFNNNYCLSMKS